MLLIIKFESRENTSLLSTFILQVDLILDREGNEGLGRDIGAYVHEQGRVGVSRGKGIHQTVFSH